MIKYFNVEEVINKTGKDIWDLSKMFNSKYPEFRENMGVDLFFSSLPYMVYLAAQNKDSDGNDCHSYWNVSSIDHLKNYGVNVEDSTEEFIEYVKSKQAKIDADGIELPMPRYSEACINDNNNNIIQDILNSSDRITITIQKG